MVPLLSIGTALLLPVAVAFWWGVVALRLVAEAFPAWLSVEFIWRLGLDPEQEGSLANAISAGTFLAVALLALANAVAGWRRSAWLAAGSWASLSAVLAVFAWADGGEFQDTRKRDVVALAFDTSLDRSAWDLSFLLLPVVAALALGAWAFARKGVLPESQRLFALGAAAVLLAIILDGLLGPLLIRHRAPGLASIIEEMLEVSGALLIGCSAAIALRHRETGAHISGGIRWCRLAAGAVATVAVLSGLTIAFVFRVPTVDARPPLHYGSFGVGLRHQATVVQEVRAPAFPIGRIDLRLDNRDPDGRSGAAGIRIGRTSHPGKLLRASVAVAANDRLRWRSVDLMPPLVEPEGVPLSMTVVAEVGPEAVLLVGATKADAYPDGRLWINGEAAWSGQDLEFVAYTAPEPTRSKLAALWWLVTSDWRWPALFAVLGVGLTLVTLTPAVLLVSARTPRRRRGVGGNTAGGQKLLYDEPSVCAESLRGASGAHGATDAEVDDQRLGKEVADGEQDDDDGHDANHPLSRSAEASRRRGGDG